MDLLTLCSITGGLGSGLIAGVFFAFSSFVMKALGKLAPREGIAAMQAINVVVLNWHFLGAFFGTALVSLATLGVAAMHWETPGAVWAATGSVLYLAGTFLVTVRCNVPLNNELAGLDRDDEVSGAGWAHYLKTWTRWNHVRTAMAFGAAASFAAAIAL